ncbi:hypothetical protein [Paenibacillus sp. YN15]|uniref:hypothetical protein n=1 Tax=Paenibacillus sp. YN15 TaxID=1742774 RepID=UPI000DCE6793|nr:hypothetical protein [Paenibacillus sp. YN15]RAU96367.1 hypothetical protein DQG13_20640 [Paenibacillus sp. YN15]
MNIRLMLCLSVLAAVLSGCFQAASPEAGSVPPAPSPTPAISPSPTELPPGEPQYLRMNPDEKRFPVTDRNSVTFRFSSNLELNRSLLEQALPKQLASNHPGRASLSYTLEWQSGKEFALTFSDLLPREIIHFQADYPPADGHGRINEEMPHLSGGAVQYRESGLAAATVVTELEPFQHRYLPSAKPFQQMAKHAETGLSYTLAYDDAGLYIASLSDGAVRTLPLPAAEDRFSLKGLHGYEAVILPKILYEDAIYAVMSHSQVYRINTRTEQARLIYTSAKPIVGMSSSPNGKLIGLMLQDERFLSEADLVIINEKGQVRNTFPEAAYISHSDGYINIYPLEWVNDNRVRVRTELPEKQYRGYREFDLAAQTAVEVPDVGQQHQELLRKLEEKEREIFPFFSPDQNRLVYITRSNDGFFMEIWVTDLTGDKQRFVGIGHFLGWVSPTAIAWAEYSAGEVKYWR